MYEVHVTSRTFGGLAGHVSTGENLPPSFVALKSEKVVKYQWFKVVTGDALSSTARQLANSLLLQ